MCMSFDPYYQWLGIPPEKQPPDCYQLLGIRRFERNPTVISHAAERQLLMLKTMQNGPHAALTQKLMNEVTAARIRLLDPEKKAQYDAEIRKQTRASKLPPPPQPPGPAATVTAAPPEAEDHPSAMALPESLKTTPRHRNRSRSAGSRRTRRAVRLVVGAVLVIGTVAVLLLWNSGGTDFSGVTEGDHPQAPMDQSSDGEGAESSPERKANRILARANESEETGESGTDLAGVESPQVMNAKQAEAESGSAIPQGMPDEDAPGAESQPALWMTRQR